MLYYANFARPFVRFVLKMKPCGSIWGWAKRVDATTLMTLYCTASTEFMSILRTWRRYWHHLYIRGSDDAPHDHARGSHMPSTPEWTHVAPDSWCHSRPSSTASKFVDGTLSLARVPAAGGGA